MPPTVWVTIIAITVTILIAAVTALINLAYKLGHTNARVEQLEMWRGNVRNDFHEVSEKLENIALELKGVIILIRERTERRFVQSKHIAPDDDRRKPEYP